MKKKTTEYVKGFEDCLSDIDQCVSRVANTYINESVDLPNMVSAWNDVVTHVEYLKIHILNMKDNMKKQGEVVQLSLVKKEE